MRRLTALLFASVAVLGTAPPATAAPAPVKHVFIIVLENKNYDQSFGAHAESSFLAHALPAQGQLLPNYHATGHVSLGNYITLVSGQSENGATQTDCIVFAPFIGFVRGDGQAVGQGCVYPSSVKTVGDQLEGRRLSWRGYMEDMGNDPGRESPTCGHPSIGSPDQTQLPTSGDQYATRHDPFMYFHSLIDDQPRCDARVVALSRLPADLRSSRTIPNYVFITPDLCSDGHDPNCSNPAQRGGYSGISDFLRRWIPRILGSPGFADNGVLMVIFDESEHGSEACCFVPGGPNATLQGRTGPGGGRTGAVIVSPFVGPGTVNNIPYNHYSLLRTTEDLFGVGHLGYAARSEVRSFGADVFSRPGGDPCLPAILSLGPRHVDRASVGESHATVARALGRRRRRVGRFDLVCLSSGGRLRIGYPPVSLRRKLSLSERRRVRGHAVLLLTTNVPYSVLGAHPGSSVSSLSNRLRGARRISARGFVWYLKRGSRSRLVIRAKRGKVVEVGLADRRLTATLRGAKRFVRAFRR